MRRFHARHRGFTMIELLIVMTIVILGAAIGFPAFSKWAKKSKVESAAFGAQTLCAQARQAAIRNGSPVVLRADLTTQEFVLFANVDLDTGYAYSPDPNATPRTTDYEIARIPLPQDAPVNFGGPSNNNGNGGGNGGGNSGNGGGKGKKGGGGGGNGNSATSWISSSAVIGLTASTSGENVAVFQADGSIEDAGAFNFGDKHENYIQLRIDPRAAAKCNVLKYNPTPSWGGDPDYFPRGSHSSGAPLWVWS